MKDGLRFSIRTLPAGALGGVSVWAYSGYVAPPSAKQRRRAQKEGQRREKKAAKAAKKDSRREDEAGGFGMAMPKPGDKVTMLLLLSLLVLTCCLQPHAAAALADALSRSRRWNTIRSVRSAG